MDCSTFLGDNLFNNFIKKRKPPKEPKREINFDKSDKII